MAGNNDTRQRRGQSAVSPAMPPVVTGAASTQPQGITPEALSGVIPQVLTAMFPGIRNVQAVSTPQAREAQGRVGQRMLGTAAALAGATGVAEDAFARAEGPAPARPRRGQGASTPAPLGQTTGQPLTGNVTAMLPPLTDQQVRANAMEQLSQYNVAQLAALQGVLPSRPEPIPVEDQIRQTMFDGATRDFLLSQSPGASVEEATAGQSRYMQMLAQILNPNPLLMNPTE
jgi:hypothetical protein